MRKRTQTELIRILAKEQRLYFLNFVKLLETKGLLDGSEVDDLFNSISELDRSWLEASLDPLEPDCPFGLCILGWDGDGPPRIQDRIAEKEPETAKDMQRRFWETE